MELHPQPQALSCYLYLFTLPKNARIITVSGANGAGAVIEHGTVLVRNGRIDGVGPSTEIAIPSGARVVDATGLTMMPGLVDSHYHGLSGSIYAQLAIPVGPLSSFKWALRSGVTTAWDATGTSNDGDLARAELIETGRLRGPRWFTSVGVVNTNINIEEVTYRSVREVEALVKRKSELGAEQCLKNYDSSDRKQSQWFAETARRFGVCIVAHAEYPERMLSRVADGYMVEHPILRAPSYSDVVQFVVRTHAIWTPHAIIANARGASNGNLTTARLFLADMEKEGYHEPLEKIERLAADWWRNVVAIPLVPYEQTLSARVGKVGASILRAGGKIAASSDFGTPFADDFEMWTLVRNGVTPGDAIRTATIAGAEKLGVQDDVGSLAPGKLADFVVLTANPLEKIENALLIKYTVVDGVIYDSDTLKVVRP